MSKKKVMLSGYYGFENFGDDLILDVLVHYLHQWDIETLVLSGNPELIERQYNTPSLMRTELHQIWQKMSEMDAFISGGGGLFQDVTGLGSPVYYGGLIEMARWRKLPVAFFAQGIGPLKTLVGRFFTTRALNHARLICVRDIKSVSLVSELTGKKADMMADPVWLWQPGQAVQDIMAQKKGLAVSLRPWPQLKGSQIHHLASCIAKLPGIQDWGVNLIDCQSGADIVPLAKLESHLKQYQIGCRWFSRNKAVLGIAQSSAFIGMRFHALLMAIQLNVPVIALSYDPKVQLMAAQVKIPDFPVTVIESLTGQRIRESLAMADKTVVLDFQRSAERGMELLKRWLQV